MKTVEAIKSIMRTQKVTQAVLAKRIGLASQQTIGMRFSQKTITTEKVAEMCKALGYKMVLMPDTAPTPKDSYEVE